VGVITAPEPLGAGHDLQSFDCGRASLNDWLRKKALKAQRTGGPARTYVVCASAGRVVGYYALATGSVNRGEAPKRVARNTPDPVPVVLIGRLAVDRAFLGQGIGSGLLKDALQRVGGAAEEIGIRAVLVHALDEQAQRFYRHFGFYESPTNDLTLMLTVEEIHRCIAGRNA